MFVENSTVHNLSAPPTQGILKYKETYAHSIPGPAGCHSWSIRLGVEWFCADPQNGYTTYDI